MAARGIGRVSLPQAVKRRLLLIILVAAPLTVGAGLYAASLPTEYEATAIVSLGPRPSQTPPGADLVRLGAPRYVAYLTAPATLSRVASRLGVTQAELQREVHASRATDTGDVSITVRSRSPADAARIANVMANEMLRFGARDHLLVATLTAPAIQPIQPSGPPRLLMVAVALLIGVLLGMAVGALLEYALRSGSVPAWGTGDGLASEMVNPPRSRAFAVLGSGPNGQRTQTHDYAQGPERLLGTTPRGWQEYIEPRFDYAIAVPPEWEPVEGQTEVMVFHDPSTGALARVERAEKASRPPEHPSWRLDEDQYDDYTRIKLESIMFKGFPALDWEFVHSEDSIRVRATELRLFVYDIAVYRISFQSPDAVWSEMGPTHDRFRDSFNVGLRAEPSIRRPEDVEDKNPSGRG